MCRIGLELYAQRSYRNLLVLGLLLLIIVTGAFHYFHNQFWAQVTKKK